ncbi:MAG: HAD family hydrolase [Methylotenera sp.]|nr:HAD family hydrolase [Oligoflexia bacterium]
MTSLPLKAVLLDVDGTLIDSNDAHAQSWKETFDHFDYPIPYERIRNRIGKGGDKLLPELIGVELESARGKELSQFRNKVFQNYYLPRLRAFPETLDLLRKMREGNLRLATATSGNREDLTALLQQIGALELFDFLISSEDAENSKPDPDILKAAVNKLGLHPSELLMIGDTPYDIEAATRAGIRTIAFKCGGRSAEELQGAARIYQGPSDLLRHYDDSPLAV